ncbi:MAG TPA: DNA recombination protein RmuC, partial [Candidatus Ruania gallistercoris]|nr:DNA recombination protein RmuC [Candidatus Ruania gallistercoris]
MDIIWLIVGLALGGAGGVLAARRTGSAAGPELARAQAEVTRLTERLSAQQEAHRRELAGSERAADERADLQQAAHERELAAEQRRSAERLAELKEGTQRLSDEFEALSAKVLAQTRKEFLEHAEERWTRSQQESVAELTKREEAVRHLVEPLTRTLGEVKQEMTSAEKERLQAHTALTEQVNAMRSSSEHLRSETSQLVNALRAPQVRGRWGELQLRNVVESAGMVEHVDFVEQPSFDTDDGALRPDLIVTLPGEKQVVIDAKVAFNGYLEAMEAKDEAVRSKRLVA